MAQHQPVPGQVLRPRMLGVVRVPVTPIGRDSQHIPVGHLGMPASSMAVERLVSKMVRLRQSRPPL